MARLLCAWHPYYYPDEDPPDMGWSETELDSHGICPRCRRKMLTSQPLYRVLKTPARSISAGAVDEFEESLRDR